MIRNHIQNCIQRCEQTANGLRNVANNVQDQRAREMLTTAATHVEMCIHSCDVAMHFSDHEPGAGQWNYR